MSHRPKTTSPPEVTPSKSTKSATPASASKEPAKAGLATKARPESATAKARPESATGGLAPKPRAESAGRIETAGPKPRPESAASLAPKPRAESAAGKRSPTPTIPKPPTPSTTPPNTPPTAPGATTGTAPVVKTATPRAAGTGRGGSALGGGLKPVARPAPPSASRNSSTLKRAVSATHNIPASAAVRSRPSPTSTPSPTPPDMASGRKSSSATRSTLASRQQDKRLAVASDKAPSRPVSLFNDQNMPKVVLGGTVGDKLFKRAWDHYDPTNTGEIKLRDFVPFFRHLEQMISTTTVDHTYALLPKDQEEQINQLIEEASGDLDADIANPDLTHVVCLWSQLNQQNNIIEKVNDLWTASYGDNTEHWDFDSKKSFFLPAPPNKSAPSPDLTGEIDFPSSMPLAQSTPVKRNPYSPISKPSPLFSTPPPRPRIGFSPPSGARRAFSPTDGLAEAEQEERESNSNIPPVNKALLNLPDPDWEGDLDLEEVMMVYTEVRRLQKAHLIFTKEVARLENDLQNEKSRAHRTALILEQQQEEVIKELEVCKKARDAFKNEAKQLKAQQEKDLADLRRADEEKLDRDKQIKQLRKETDNLRQLHNANKTQKVQDQAAVEKAHEELKKVQAKHKQLLERYEHEQIARTQLEDNLRAVQEEFEIQRQENEEKEELIVEQTNRIEVLTTDVERLEKHIQRQSVASTTFDAESDDVSSSGDSAEPDSSDYGFSSRAGRNTSPLPPAEDNDTRLHRVRSATLTVDRLQVVDKVTRMNYTGVGVQTDLSISDEKTVGQFTYWIEAEDPGIAALDLLRDYSETGRQFVEALETETTVEENLEEPESPQLAQEPEPEPEPKPKPKPPMEEKSVQVTAPEPEPPILISRSAQTIPQVISMATAATSTDSLPITPPMPQEEFPFPVRSRSNSARSQRRPSVPTIPELVEAADPEPATEPDQPPANLFTTYTSSCSATVASPDDTYTEVISTTHAKRLRLAALSNKPLLTLDDREFIWDFIVEQSTHDRHLLSNIWTAAIKSEDAVKAASFDTPYKPNMTPPLLHSPIAALGNPLRMLFDAFVGNLDLTDYQAAATRGEREIKDRIRAEILAEMTRSPEAVMAAVRTLEASVGATPGQSTFSGEGTTTPGHNNVHPQPSPAPTNATDSTPRQQTYPLSSETPKRAPVGAQAVLLRAGPKPSSVWSILSLVMWAVILFMAASNLHMYWYMKTDQGAWAVANDITGVGTGWRNGGSCYRVCSDGWGWRWKALVREWFIEEVGIRWPS